MGASKSDFFNEQQNYTANLFKALAHPARIAIIEHLLNVNTCICGDLVDILPLSQATVSQHLRELKDAKVIKGSIDGNSICYCLNEETLGHITQILQGYSEKIKACGTDQNKCC
jgi:DNA-binding transcriptional ArsR family regulator